MRNAYVGVQQTTVASFAKRCSSRADVVIPPAGRQKLPNSVAASKAAQKPTNGPNENGKKIRSDAVTSAPL